MTEKVFLDDETIALVILMIKQGKTHFEEGKQIQELSSFIAYTEGLVDWGTIQKRVKLLIGKKVMMPTMRGYRVNSNVLNYVKENYSGELHG